MSSIITQAGEFLDAALAHREKVWANEPNPVTPEWERSAREADEALEIERATFKAAVTLSGLTLEQLERWINA